VITFFPRLTIMAGLVPATYEHRPTRVRMGSQHKAGNDGSLRAAPLSAPRVRAFRVFRGSTLFVWSVNNSFPRGITS